MSLTILDAISLKGDGAHNEDVYGAENDFAWVLDGATGIADSSITNHTSDAGWYVERVDNELRNVIRKQPGVHTQELLRKAIKAVAEDYRAAIKNQEEPLFAPSAAFAMLRVQGHGVEFSGLGDCAALFTNKDGSIGYFEGDQGEAIDKQSIQRLITEQTKTPDAGHEEIVDRIKPFLRRNRSRMNTPEGYWILSFSEASLNHTYTQRTELDPRKPVILMSDGFTRLLQMLDGMNQEKLYQAILSKGVHSTGALLREIESKDSSCRRYPRFKKSDDATCVVVSLS